MATVTQSRSVPVVGHRFYGIVGAIVILAGFLWGGGWFLTTQRWCDSAFQLPSMGTVFEIQYVRRCNERAGVEPLLMRSVQDRLDHWENSMSLYQTRSEVSRLNRSGRLRGASRDLLSLIEQALNLSALTEGYFDITIWPVLKSIQEAFKNTGEPPPVSSLRRHRGHVSYRWVRVRNDGIEFLKSGVGITLDGIAKGYAVDAIADWLGTQGIRSYLVNFSGNLKVRGKTSRRRPWKIAIHNPVTGQAFEVELTDGAVASSGLAYQSYSSNKRWHHLINPRTLTPARGLAGAAVSGPTAMVCDALSTAVLVMGLAEAQRILPAHFPQYRFWTF